MAFHPSCARRGMATPMISNSSSAVRPKMNPGRSNCRAYLASFQYCDPDYIMLRCVGQNQKMGFTWGQQADRSKHGARSRPPGKTRTLHCPEVRLQPKRSPARPEICCRCPRPEPGSGFQQLRCIPCARSPGRPVARSVVDIQVDVSAASISPRSRLGSGGGDTHSGG